MQFFRGIVIGTLNFVAFLAFIATIILAGVGGWVSGPEILGQFGLAEAAADWNIPQPAYAAIGAVMGWIVASIALGVLFVLIDIQDGIRDLHRDLTKKPGDAV